MEDGAPGLVKSVWISDRALFIFRVIALLYTTTFQVYCGSFGPSYRLYIYLTIWTFILLNLYLLMAVLVTIFHESPHGPRLGAIISPFHSLTATTTCMVMVLFWTAVYPTAPSMGINPCEFIQHGSNALIMSIDTVFSRVKFYYLRDAIVVATYAAMYVLWSLVWFGMHPEDKIYPILDWHSPIVAGVVPGAFLVLFGILYGWTRLSQWKDRYLKAGRMEITLLEPPGSKLDASQPTTLYEDA